MLPILDIVMLNLVGVNDMNFLMFQIVECNALPTLILMLRSEDAAIHYEAVSFPDY